MATLSEVLDVLRAIAPPHLAGDWDNVGLLLEGVREVRRIWLCIDLTEAVLDEALAAEADLVVAYHPPIFGGLKRITAQTPVGRVLLAASRSGVHIYSPHTALDAAADGMNDWLLLAFGALSDVRPIAPDAADGSVGAGRRATLDTPVSLEGAVHAIQDHLGLSAVRVAAPPELRWGDDIRSVAVCPGAGGSVFAALDHADLLLTGEMRHHDVLARVASGSAVVLTDHTNTERGYLPLLAHRLAEALPGVQTRCSEVDADPLRVWPAAGA